MTAICRVCTHPQRAEIDQAIIKGGSMPSIARDFCLENHSIYFHAKHHVSRSLVKAMEKKLMLEGNELMDTIIRIIERAENIFNRNYDAKKDLLALKALSAQRETIQLLSNISAQIHQAKIAEAALLKEQSGDAQAEAEEAFKQKLSVALSMEELKVYSRLTNKIWNQNNDVIIKNGKVLVYSNKNKA